MCKYRKSSWKTCRDLLIPLFFLYTIVLLTAVILSIILDISLHIMRYTYNYLAYITIQDLILPLQKGATILEIFKT